MEAKTNDYHISFFKPTTPRALVNRNMIIWLVSIWALAVFGFQILLKVMEKPTPEPTYDAYVSVKDQVESGNATPEELKTFAGANLSVLSKVFIAPEDKVVLSNAFNWSLYQLLDEGQKAELIPQVEKFEQLKEEISQIDEPSYVEAKNQLSAAISPILGLSENDVERVILPMELRAGQMEEFTVENKESLAGVMEKYLIHNRSALTDTAFLGFPFHYFYTAVFLLFLFVFLCWLYCVRADSLNKKFNIAD